MRRSFNLENYHFIKTMINKPFLSIQSFLYWSGCIKDWSVGNFIKCREKVTLILVLNMYIGLNIAIMFLYAFWLINNVVVVSISKFKPSWIIQFRMIMDLSTCLHMQNVEKKYCKFLRNIFMIHIDILQLIKIVKNVIAYITNVLICEKVSLAHATQFVFARIWLDWLELISSLFTRNWMSYLGESILITLLTPVSIKSHTANHLLFHI